MGIRNNRYDAQVPTVVSELQRVNSVHGKSVKYCLDNSDSNFKFTLPGPMTICDTIANGYYSSKKEMALKFAEILNEEALELEKLGVHTIQFDEPAFNAFTEEASEWGVDLLEIAKSGLKCKTAVHICYGYGIKQNIEWKNSLGSQWRQYEDFFPTLNKSSIDQISLECANSKVPLEVLSLLNKKEILVGAIDVASLEIETPQNVFETLKKVSNYVQPQNIIACTNCGMAPMPFNVAEKKIKSLVNGTKLFSKYIGH
jgi:5-methyltetrahydropteroyltriglutamate--homocysteine methyltransferase